jgi:hypothetical protein
MITQNFEFEYRNLSVAEFSALDHSGSSIRAAIMQLVDYHLADNRIGRCIQWFRLDVRLELLAWYVGGVVSSLFDCHDTMDAMLAQGDCCSS